MPRRWMWVTALCLTVIAALTFRGVGQATRETMATGYGYVTMGWLPEAVRQFKQAGRERPDDLEALIAAGIASQAMGHEREAEKALLDGARRDSGAPELWALVGDIRLSVGDLPGAEDAFRRALEFDGELALAHRGLGLIAEQRGDADDAVARYEQALEAAPGLQKIRVHLARLLIDAERWDDALEHLEFARRMAPRDAEPHWLLARVYEATGDAARARHILTRTLQLDPDHGPAARMLEEMEAE